MHNRNLVIRWTIGDVSPNGFEALGLSLWGARKVFGDGPSFVVCVNSVTVAEAKERCGDVPGEVEWLQVELQIPKWLEPYLDDGMAEGVAWKFLPLRIATESHELALDNDCILWEMPQSVKRWLANPNGCLIAEDVRPALGKFASVCGNVARNSGMRGIPPRFDLEQALRDCLAENPVLLTSELDEQGLQVAAVSRKRQPVVVRLGEVSICSPFPPHLPLFGKCGAHFVGLNAKHLPWELEGRPAVDYIAEHWEQHRNALYERVVIRRTKEHPALR
jgi:hypothetical protein